MIKPTVGRVVLYRPTTSDPLGEELVSGIAKEGRRYAAIVVHVWSQNLVNLTVFSPNGVPFAKTSVTLVDGDYAPQMGQAEWMEYQKSVASGELSPTLHAT